MTAPPTVPLLAVAHGSRDPRSARTMESLLARVRQRLPRTTVRLAFLDHETPDPATAARNLASEGAGEVVVLPVLLTAAYHSKVDLPTILDQIHTDCPWLGLRSAAPLGPHPLLVAAVTRRLAEVGVHPRADTAVVLAGAGSSDSEAVRTVEAVAHELAAGGWHDAVAAHASMATPRPEDAARALRRAGATRVAVARYLLADGVFADRIAHQAHAGGADIVTSPLGDTAEVAAVVVERYLRALPEPAIPSHPAGAPARRPPPCDPGGPPA